MKIRNTNNTKKLSSIIKAVSITLIFGALYLIIARYYNDPLEPWMSYYHSLITQTTLGYDWYLPKKPLYFAVNSIQMILVWVFVLFELVV
jgi:quinol-cytochrome oxidoreductase complex cytochrome b subunit